MSSYERAIELLKESLKFGIEPSLKGIETLCARMHNPQRNYACIQIAGTNGKSSTSRYTAALLRKSGVKVGLYTSPELVEYRERIEVDGSPVSREVFGDAICRVFELAQEGETFTEFEILTAAAFLVFFEAGIDFAVLEVGLGGTWDATTIANASVACITGIGLDHTAILGDTVEKIAHEKVGIIKPAQTVIMGPGCAQNKVREVITNRAREKGALLYSLSCGEVVLPEVSPQLQRSYHVVHEPSSFEDELSVKTSGLYAEYICNTSRVPIYQAPNIATSILVAEAALGRAIEVGDTFELSIPGRFELLSENPFFMIDATHNPQSAEQLARAIQTAFPKKSDRPRILLGILKDKDASGIIDALLSVCNEFAITKSHSARARNEEDLAALLRSKMERSHKGNPAFPVYSSVDEALSVLLKSDERILATGSITIAGEAKAFSYKSSINKN